MKKAILFYLFLSSFLFSCTTKELRVKEYQVPADAPNSALPTEEYYVVGPGDSLAVTVWKEPDLSGTAQVRPDGFITLPLINEIQVTGLTTAQVRQILEEKYKEFVNNPFVTIRVGGIRSSEVFIMGNAARQGAVQLVRNDTILQFLLRNGGLNIYADRDNIRVLRRDGDKITEFVVDYDAIIAGDLKQDILLRPGDRIIVP